jgi:hypothetical protein
MSFRTCVTVFLVAAAVVAVVAIRVVTGSGSAGNDPVIPHFGDADVRIRITADAQVSRGQDPMLVQLESGEIPAGVTHLTVLTDENCQPDADGVSHCRNRAQFSTLDGEREIVLRHHHRMAEEPCLAPGQVVELVG